MGRFAGRRCYGPVLMNDLTDAKILVIGGAGFVGSHIVDQLLEEPVAEIIVLDNFVRGTRDEPRRRRSRRARRRSSRARSSTATCSQS